MKKWVSKQKLLKIYSVLKQYYKPNLFSEPFHVLVFAVLSARTKEEITEKAAAKLLRIADTPEKLARLSITKIASLIKPVGFYKQKAKKLKQLARMLQYQFNSIVPSNKKQLMKLPGVGNKIADVVLADAFGMPIIAVDVHVAVIARRLGLVDSTNYDEIQQTLQDLFLNVIKPDQLKYINRGFVFFGKQICTTAKPRCNICPLTDVCDYFNKKK